LNGYFITPGQFAHRAAFYQQLGELTNAGIVLTAALEQIERHPPDRSYLEPIRRLRAEIVGGFTLSESLQRLGPWLPDFDIALLQAGEQSGRLDTCFRSLADYYSERARLVRQMLADMAYPGFLFHFAIFIMPFPRLFSSGNWIVYLLQTFGVLLPLYGVLALAVYAAQSRHGETWRGRLEALLHPVPILGSGRRSLALSRLSAALEALLRAGVSIIQAWELAAKACGSPFLRRLVASWRPQLDAGRTPAEEVSASGQFPELFAGQYATGEISGQLDDTLARLHRYYREEGWRKLHAVAQWTPRVIYLGVALMIAYRVVRFWLGYFNDIRNAGGF
jgi:type II secretory pathway component PulF